MDAMYVAIGAGFRKKPAGVEIKKIRSDTSRSYGYYSIEQIAELVGDQGHTLIPAYLEGGMRAECFREIQIFLLDFDGEKEEIIGGRAIKKGNSISYESIRDRAEQYGLPIAFAYKTFSCSNTGPVYKFRVAFIHQVPVTDRNLAMLVYRELREVFPECDTACLELSRMFFGGKGLLDLNPEARFSLVHLNYLLDHFADRNNNHNRKIKQIVKNIDIAVINHKIAVGTLDTLSVFYEKADDPDVVTLIGNADFPSFFYIKKSSDIKILHQKKTRVSEKHRIDLKRKEGICRLLDDFMKGIYLNHMQRFMIATNLKCVSNGLDLYTEILKDHYDADAIEKWFSDKKYIKGYSPMECRPEHCPYYDECCKVSSYHNIIDRLLHDKRISIGSYYRYATLEEAAQQMEDNFNKAMSSSKPGFHFITAQTGMGKTRAIIRYIESHPYERILIAEPLNSKKRELYEDISRITESVTYTKSVQESSFLSKEEKSLYQHLHDIGQHSQARDIIRDKREQLQKESPELKAAIEELMELESGIFGCIDAAIVITTHARLINIPEQILRSYSAIIIDEDILYNQLLNSNCKVSRQCLEFLKNESIAGYSSIAAQMLKAKPGRYYNAQWNINWVRFLNTPEVEGMSFEEDSSEADDNYGDLVRAGAYTRTDDVFNYLCRYQLPDLKYIVLSATADAELYRRYFQSIDVYEYDQVHALYKGKLTQYTYHSLSRRGLEQHQEVYQFIKENIGNIQKISFKKEEMVHQLNDKGGHFGNMIGVNCYEGNDIAVIGTPFKHPMNYLLPCCCLYGEVVANHNTMRAQRVQYKSREFNIMAFDNDRLQKYQMFSIESELEQVIGRSRLLRYPSKVFLFSSFPCEQATIITTDYLKKYQENRNGQAS